MEANTGAKAPVREVREAGDNTTPPESGHEAVRRAAQGEPKDAETRDAALDWLLSDEPADEGDDTLDLELNVGGARPGSERWIIWTIKAVDGEVIRRIRRQSAGVGAGRQARRAQQGTDDELANRRIVVAGTEHPPIKKIAQERGIADPATLIEMKFQRKPGLVQQLVMEILSLSGYDDDDVREVTAARN